MHNEKSLIIVNELKIIVGLLTTCIKPAYLLFLYANQQFSICFYQRNFKNIVHNKQNW